MAKTVKTGIKDQAVIAAKFGIGESLIAQIVTNRCWRDTPFIASPTPPPRTRSEAGRC